MRGFLGLISILLGLIVVIWLAMHGLKGYMGSGDSKSLDGAKSRSEAIVCRTNRKAMQTDILQFRSNSPGKPVTIEALREAGAQIPECPSGGRYTIEGNRVICSIHGQ